MTPVIGSSSLLSKWTTAPSLFTPLENCFAIASCIFSLSIFWQACITNLSSCHGKRKTNLLSRVTIGVQDSCTCLIQSRSGTLSTSYRGFDGQWKVYLMESTMEDTSNIDDGKCAVTSHRFQILRPAATSLITTAHSFNSFSDISSSSRSLTQVVNEGSSKSGSSSSVSASASVMLTEHAPISMRKSDRFCTSKAAPSSFSITCPLSSVSGADNPRKVIWRRTHGADSSSSS
mmetsp:Transcript_860/g.1670  ORF Transcript_860/g.1670 Transcript_860/m.1670 type:complete len:232 (-) Transcript_860:254-949(-)